MCTTYQGYLQAIAETLRERAAQAKMEVEQLRGITGKAPSLAFQRGILLGYYEVLSTMVSQAEAFDIPLETIGLADFQPDKLLS